MNNVSIEFVGVLGGADGYGAANRGLCKYLQRKTPLIIRTLGGHERFLDMSVASPGAADVDKPTAQAADWRLVRCSANKYPDFHSITAPQNALWTVWELEQMPDSWIRGCKVADRVITSTHFCQRILQQHGITSTVVPEGIDPDHYSPNPMPRNRFRFLLVGEWNPRKGIQQFVKAWCETFARNKDVELLLKLSLPPGVRGHEVETVCRSLNRGGANLVLAIGNVRDDRMANEVYNRANVLVSPSHAEAYNRPVMEAAACGVPSIVTGWGGHMDYLKETNAWIIPYQMVPCLGWDDYKAEYQWAQPDLGAFVKAMIYASDNPGEVERRGREALKLREEYSWDRCTDELLKALEA